VNSTEKEAIIRYRDIVEHIDRMFPWFFLSIVLFLSSFVGSITGVVLFLGERSIALLMAIFVIFVPVYTSMFSFIILTRIYRNRFKLHDYVIRNSQHSSHKSFDERVLGNEEDSVVDNIYRKTKSDLRLFPASVFVCFIVLLFVDVLMLFLPRAFW